MKRVKDMLENMSIYLNYHTKEGNNIISTSQAQSNQDVEMIFEKTKEEKNIKLVVKLIPKKELEVLDIHIDLPFMYNENHRVFCNGYQSWTDSKELTINEKMKGISKIAQSKVSKYQFDKYGDYLFHSYSNKAGDFHGFTYSYIRDNDKFILIGSLTERNGYTIIEHSIKNSLITIRKDLQGVKLKDSYLVFEIIIIEGKEDEVFNLYFDKMNIKKPTLKPMTGWTSWYNYYQNISEEIIIDNLNNFKNKKPWIDIFQIDDGYQTHVGDWLSIDKRKFPNGMKFLADNIKSNGVKAGLWLAPFVCETDSKIFKEKKDWLVRDEEGKLLPAGSNWSTFYILDIYNEEVREYIKKVFDTVLDEWGYDLVKLDFLYAVCLVPRMNKSRGQIMTEAMEFLRECVKDKLILGCGVPLGPAFGLVDYCRIGCDVGLDWDDKWFMRLIHRERVSTLNAINNAIGRRHLNKRAFLNDPDVFLLREDNISLTKTQKETLFVINYIFGSLLFTSDNIKEYDDNKNAMFDMIKDFESKKIISVDRSDTNLITVVYENRNEAYVAYINLSGKTIKFINNSSTKEELDFKTNTYKKENDESIIIEPYQSRCFKG